MDDAAFDDIGRTDEGYSLRRCHASGGPISFGSLVWRLPSGSREVFDVRPSAGHRDLRRKGPRAPISLQHHCAREVGAPKIYDLEISLQQCVEERSALFQAG